MIKLIIFDLGKVILDFSFSSVAEGLADLIERLKKDFRLCLLSNTNELHFEFIRKNFPVVYKFDMWVLSYEAGVMKPDPEIFRIALRKAGIEAEEAIFIDDIRGHVFGAQGLGINSVEFKSVAQITRFIEETVYESCYLCN